MRRTMEAVDHIFSMCKSAVALISIIFIGIRISFAYNKSSVIVNETVSDSDVMQASIGQGTDSITPLHMNMITCAIANDGMLMKPYLIDHVENENGS
mgnify:CR=1 FL=1